MLGRRKLVFGRFLNSRLRRIDRRVLLGQIDVGWQLGNVGRRGSGSIHHGCFIKPSTPVFKTNSPELIKGKCVCPSVGLRMRCFLYSTVRSCASCWRDDTTVTTCNGADDVERWH